MVNIVRIATLLLSVYSHPEQEEYDYIREQIIVINNCECNKW